jgi:peptidoglycan-associated lipoprotein
MKREVGFLAACLTIVVIAAATACKPKAPKTVAEERPPAAATPAPAVPPRATPPPARNEDVLSGDLADINRRGYVKDAFYDYNQATLREGDRNTLAADADWLKRYPSVQILIEGHCDERGTSEYNLALGDRRANAAKEYLGSLGVDASRIRTVSYGKERPFCTESSESCWQQNRRAHFVITAK